jgi:hypothetical protein
MFDTSHSVSTWRAPGAAGQEAFAASETLCGPSLRHWAVTVISAGIPLFCITRRLREHRASRNEIHRKCDAETL